MRFLWQRTLTGEWGERRGRAEMRTHRWYWWSLPKQVPPGSHWKSQKKRKSRGLPVLPWKSGKGAAGLSETCGDSACHWAGIPDPEAGGTVLIGEEKQQRNNTAAQEHPEGTFWSLSPTPGAAESAHDHTEKRNQLGGPHSGLHRADTDARQRAVCCPQDRGEARSFESPCCISSCPFYLFNRGQHTHSFPL